MTEVSGRTAKVDATSQMRRRRRRDLAHASPMAERARLRAVAVARAAGQAVECRPIAWRGASGPKPNAGTVGPKIVDRRRAHGGREVLRRRIVGDDTRAAPDELRRGERAVSVDRSHRSTRAAVAADGIDDLSGERLSSAPPMTTTRPIVRSAAARAG